LKFPDGQEVPGAQDNYGADPQNNKRVTIDLKGAGYDLKLAADRGYAAAQVNSEFFLWMATSL
jgi:hypothetical protein